MTVSLSETNDDPSGRWIPWAIAGFFVCLTGVLATFVWIAVSTQTGVVTENAYQKGLAYNQILDEGAKEATVVWNGTLTAHSASAGQVVVELALRDVPAHAAIQARVWAVRADSSKLDRNQPMPRTGDAWRATWNDLPAGRWELHATARVDGQERQFHTSVMVE